MIPYATQDINESDIEAVIAVLKSDWLTQGPAISSFEKAVADYCGAQYAVAVNSATSALHIACIALGLGPGDTLWTSPNTFVASANCALYCGAKVDFVDINRKTYNLDTAELKKKLKIADREGKLPKIVVAVHFAGQSCEMKEIAKLAREYNFSIIEDASHALGGQYEQSAIGNCKYSDVTVFSFHPVKMITTGEGGMSLCNNPDISAKMQRLRSHGITRDKALMKTEVDGDWSYQQIELGYNYRMTDIQAALGENQLHRLDEFVARRYQIRKYYDEALSGLPLILPYQHKDTKSSLHLYPVKIDVSKCHRDRKSVFNEMKNNGVGVNIHYIPVHCQPYYQQLGFRTGDYPVAEDYYQHALSLPVYSSMTDDQAHSVTEILERVLRQ